MPGRVCRRYPEGLGGEIKWNGKNAEVIRALNLKPIEDGRRLGRSDQSGDKPTPKYPVAAVVGRFGAFDWVWRQSHQP
jgi:hypothetical protein